MMEWKKVNRCKECGKIYEKGLPYICRKCGAEISRPTSLLVQALGGGAVTLTEKCEKVIAKRCLFESKRK